MVCPGPMVHKLALQSKWEKAQDDAQTETRRASQHKSVITTGRHSDSLTQSLSD